MERTDQLRTGGRHIDIKGAAQKILQRVGLETAVRAANTGEKGVRFVDSRNQVKVELPKGKASFGTSELEILRGIWQVSCTKTRSQTSLIALAIRSLPWKKRRTMSKLLLKKVLPGTSAS